MNMEKKFCIRETPNLLTNADGSTRIFCPLGWTKGLTEFIFSFPPPPAVVDMAGADQEVGLPLGD